MIAVQLFLYHGLDVTGTIEVSDDGVAWVSARLPSTMGVEDALAAWKTAAGAALATRVFTFSMNATTGVITISATGGSTWYRMSASLAELLGLYLTGSLPVSSTTTPTGYTLPTSGVLVGRSVPVDRESAELTEYRAGRSTSYQYGRVREVELSLYCPDALRVALVEGPLLSAHGKIRVRLSDEADPYAADALTGYLDVFPCEPEDPVYIEGTDDEVAVKFVGTLSDDELGAAFLARWGIP